MHTLTLQTYGAHKRPIFTELLEKTPQQVVEAVEAVGTVEAAEKKMVEVEEGAQDPHQEEPQEVMEATGETNSLDNPQT